MPLDMHAAEAFRRSLIAHQLASGSSCAALLQHSESPPAMLLERLGPNLAELGMPLQRVLETIAATLRSFWRPVAPDVALPTTRDQAAWLAAYIESTWNELDRPCERAVIDRALELCVSRSDAFDENNAMLVHGDAHGWNTLAAGDGLFKFVDPEGLRSDASTTCRYRSASTTNRCSTATPSIWSENERNCSHGCATPMRRPCGSGVSSNVSRPASPTSRSSPAAKDSPSWK